MVQQQNMQTNNNLKTIKNWNFVFFFPVFVEPNRKHAVVRGKQLARVGFGAADDAAGLVLHTHILLACYYYFFFPAFLHVFF